MTSTQAVEPLLPTVQATGKKIRTTKDGKMQTDNLALSSSTTSASAAIARSLFLFLGVMFRRPSKLFRPSRVDTWGGLRHLALQANQTLSPHFIRTLLKSRDGMMAMFVTVLPPLVVNTTLGFLLFTSHSFFALCLARIPFFRHIHNPEEEPPHHSTYLRGSISTDKQVCEEEEEISLRSLISGPTVIPSHPTLLSALAGAGAGIVQGVAFTPIENVVRLVQQSATSLTSIFVRIFRLPIKTIPSSEPIPANPLEALRTFFSSDTWRKNPSWWTGWRWTVARDALSYSVFFAAFDLTRRAGLRVKSFFGGPMSYEYHNIMSWTMPESEEEYAKAQERHNNTPTGARLAQAGTIVAGGVAASLAAEMAGRPFRACQKIMQAAKAADHASPSTRLPRGKHPILSVYHHQGLRPFLHPDNPILSKGARAPVERPLRLMLSRFGWRLASVGPWGLGFLVWAWVGGEV